MHIIGFFGKHDEVHMANQAESFTPVQIANLLPTQKEICALMVRLGCKEDEVYPDLLRAIRRIMAGIATSPTNHQLWRDLALAFGIQPEMKWKYLYIAHKLCPSDLVVLGEIAWICDMLGDYQQAEKIQCQRVALAGTPEERAKVLEDISCMEFNELAQRASVQLESFMHH